MYNLHDLFLPMHEEQTLHHMVHGVVRFLRLTVILCQLPIDAIDPLTL